MLCLTPFIEVAQVVLLKSCGHAICSDCFFLYRGTAAGNRCLLCRSPITAGDVQKVAIAQKVEKKEEDPPLQLQGTSATGNVMPKLSDTIFSIFPELAKVEQTEIVGLWSSKVSADFFPFEVIYFINMGYYRLLYSPRILSFVNRIRLPQNMLSFPRGGTPWSSSRQP